MGMAAPTNQCPTWSGAGLLPSDGILPSTLLTSGSTWNTAAQEAAKSAVKATALGPWRQHAHVLNGFIGTPPIGFLITGLVALFENNCLVRGDLQARFTRTVKKPGSEAIQQ